MAPRFGSAEANRSPGAASRGTWMTEMSNVGSNSTTVPSSRRSSAVATRTARLGAPATTWALVTT